MSVVEIALKRPYTVVASLILICLMGIGAALRMPIDIFPEIDIPVVAVVWTYNGMSAAGHAEPHLDAARAAAGVPGRQHLAHRGRELPGRRRGEDLPERRRRRDAGRLAAREQRPGRAQVHAAEHHAALGAALRGHGCADHSTQPVEQVAARHQAQRPGPEHHPSGARRRARRGSSLSLRRQAARDHGGSGFAGAAGARSVAPPT